MPYKAYISSTHDDLRECRAAVHDVVVKLGLLPVLEDDFGLSIRQEDQAYLKQQLMSAQVFIGVYAYRYGQMVGDKSLLELEYEWALANGLKCLIFCVNPDVPWPIKYVDRGEDAERLEAFMARIHATARVNYFMNPYDLKIQTFLGVHQALEMLRSKDGMILQRSTFGKPLDDEQYMSDIFMIMPFQERLGRIYREVIVPAVEAQGASIKRGDDYLSEQAIIREVWSAIYHARIIIAELTTRNANVFYELGIAHTIGKPVIMLTQDIDDIPFDIRHLRFIVYEDTPAGLLRLTEQLASACQVLLAEIHS